MTYPLIWPLVWVVLLSGCGTQLDTSRYPLAQTYTNSVAMGAPFRHRVVVKEGSGSNLHVYIEGDGRPWITPTSKALDPTPQRPLMLDLMSLDAAPALYLGRPCYFATRDTHCDNSRWWTSHRYSDAVVRSLNAVLDHYAGAYTAITLIGHSGGGTLAFLMATRRRDVRALVTLAANLDIDLWVQQHGYTSLWGSRNPAGEFPLPADIQQRHFLGDRDTVVSAEVIHNVLKKQHNARLEVLTDVDHRCCWRQLWPDILAQLK